VARFLGFQKEPDRQFPSKSNDNRGDRSIGTGKLVRVPSPNGLPPCLKLSNTQFLTEMDGMVERYLDVPCMGNRDKKVKSVLMVD
jgi:hypothetical protein